MHFDRKTAVVTGAASGLGRALVLELAVRGARVAASDIDDVGLAETRRLCPTSADVRCYPLDVADRAAVLEHADEVSRDFGTVNLVINNAGVAVGATVEDMTFDDLDWILGINLLGVINGTKAFLPALIASGDGHLVNLSSVFGLIAPPTQSAYSTAKFGVRGFTESLRQEMIATRRPVTVHCVHPGGIKTNIARNARMSAVLTRNGIDVGSSFDRIASTTPARATHTILRGVERNKARILIGPDAYLFLAAQQLLGSRYENIVGRMARLGASRFPLSAAAG